jgi:branched-chain amino acid transport system permease protein
MELYAQLLVNTLQIGSVYVLFALGLTLIFGVMKIVNFAHGEFFTVAAFVVSVVMPWAGVTVGLPIWLAFLIAFVCANLFVLALAFVVYQFGFAKYNRDLIGSFILAVGLILVMEGSILAIFGGAPRTVPAVVEGRLHILGAAITTQRLVIVAVAILFTLALYLLVQHTKLGLALRAVSEDHEAAMLQGIRYRRASLYGFLIGTTLASVAGAVMAPQVAITSFMGADFVVKAFIIIIIGGLGSIPGAIIGGFVIAFIDSFGGFFFDPSIATISMFAIVMVLLIVRPQGIMGHVER